MCNRCDPRCVRSVPVTPEIASAAKAVASLYEVHCAGGGAHVVTDDMNVDDDDLAFCMNWKDTDDVARHALLTLQPLTRLQRVKAIQMGLYQ